MKQLEYTLQFDPKRSLGQDEFECTYMKLECGNTHLNLEEKWCLWVA